MRGGGAWEELCIGRELSSVLVEMSRIVARSEVQWSKG